MQGGRRRKLSRRRRRRRVIIGDSWTEVVHHVGKLLSQELLEAGVGELRTGVEL